MTQPLEEKGFEEALQKELKIKGKMQFILRAGYVKNYPDPVTLRMPVERIIYQLNLKSPRFRFAQNPPLIKGVIKIRKFSKPSLSKSGRGIC
jgi:hypothetical protein